MYAARGFPPRPYIRSSSPGISALRSPLGVHQSRPLVNATWKATWLYIASNIIAIVMILCFLLIGALEIASLAQSTSTVYGETASTGAGFWCGIFFAIAAVLVLLINFMFHTRYWAMIALIASIVAACFAIILIGLDSKAVADEQQFSGVSKPKIIAAQLAFAVIEFLACIAFICLYIVIRSMVHSRLHRQPRGFGR